MLTNNQIPFAVINPNGSISRIGSCSNEDLAYQYMEGQVVVTGIDTKTISDEIHYWNGSAFVAYPDRPSDFHDWDGTNWVDSRSPEQIEADQSARVEFARSTASLTKLQFVMAVVQGGIISQASGLAMLDGTLPVELDGLTVGMTDMEKFELSAKLKGALQIDRMDPFIIASGQFLGLSDEQMDAVFGIQPPA